VQQVSGQVYQGNLDDSEATANITRQCYFYTYWLCL